MTATPTESITALSTQEKIRYGFCLDQIKHGLDLMESGWREIAEGVAVIRDQRLYREEFGTFKEFCDRKINLTRGRVDQLIAAAKTIANIEETTTRVVVLPQTEKQVRSLAALPAAEQSAAWEEAVELSGGQQPTANTVKQVVDQRKAEAETSPLHDFQEGDFVKVRGIGQPGLVIEATDSMVKVEIPQGDQVQQTWLSAAMVDECEAPIDGELIDLETPEPIPSEDPTQEHYTPDHIVQAVLEVFSGSIDLDPCSNLGTPNIKAETHYTRLCDGLAQDWTTAETIYCNPPYTPSGTLQRWAEKLTEWSTADGGLGPGQAAIVLVPAYTDTAWWEILTSGSATVCFIKGRLTFKGNNDPARFPSAVVMLAEHELLHHRFYKTFSKLGHVWREVIPCRRRQAQG